MGGSFVNIYDQQYLQPAASIFSPNKWDALRIIIFVFIDSGPKSLAILSERAGSRKCHYVKTANPIDSSQLFLFNHNGAMIQSSQGQHVQAYQHHYQSKLYKYHLIAGGAAVCGGHQNCW